MAVDQDSESEVHPPLMVSADDGSDDDEEEEEEEEEEVGSAAPALIGVAECRRHLDALGEPPLREAVEKAWDAITSIDISLLSDLERLHFAPLPPAMDPRRWAAHLARKENELRANASNTQLPFRALIQTEELYRCYELLLRDAEMDVIRLSMTSHSPTPSLRSMENEEEGDPPNEDLLRILSEAKEGPVIEVDLKGRGLTNIPDAFGRISTIVSLDLSENKLKELSYAIGGLVNLKILNVEHNNLESLPDSISLLKNLKVLNVSSNKLTVLPESILHCSSLVSLIANLNQLSYLPSQIGFSLVDLEQLSLQWNKLQSLPASICNLKSLKRLEARFNHLKALPSSIGNLTNLEVLDVGCNFKDLQTMPDTIGDLTSLVEIDLSCNQIKILPASFGKLQNLKRVNIIDNPLVIPPMKVAEAGLEAIVTFMKERWQSVLEEERNRLVEEENGQYQGKRFLPLAGSWFAKARSVVTSRPSQTSTINNLLNQQL